MIDHQARVTDLVPQRYGILALALGAGLASVAALEAAHWWLPELSRMTGGSRLIALDLASDAALGNWFSSTTLGLAAAVAVVVFSVRRHRKDDYHGRYRVWLWAAALWAFMSIDEGASLHEGLTEAASHFGGQRGYGGGPIWWIAAYGLLFAGVGTRLFLEMRRCRLSSGALLSAVGCLIAAVIVKLGFIPSLAPYSVMTEEGCEMLGDVLLLFSMAAHARYTILDAQGAITHKAKKAKAPKPEKAAAVEAKKGPASKPAPTPAKRSWFGRGAVDAAHNSPPPPASKTHEGSKSGGKSASSKPAARPPLESDDDDGETRTARKQRSAPEDDDYDYQADRRLSKAERKAMRRERDRPGRS